MIPFLRRFGIAIAYAVCIFILSSIPTLRSPDLGLNFQDKIYHIIEYGIFGFLLQRGASAVSGSSFKRFLLVFFIGVLYAASDEIHQLFVPGRQCDFFDFLSDAAGMCAGQIFFCINKKFLKSRKKN